MLELDALAMLRTFGESRYSPSIRNCVKTMGMLATSIYTIDNSQAWFCFLMVKLLSHWLLSPERYHRELCGFKSFYLGQKLDKHACLHMPPHASTWLHMTPLCIGSRLVAAWKLTLCTGHPPAKVEVPAPVQVMLKPHSKTEKGATLQYVTTTTL
jgi:hypothetical protein